MTLTTRPLVSIALCTYNGGKYLHQQLNSIVNQDYPNLEIFAVDDGSTDDTRNILLAYQAQYKHFNVVFNDENLGFNDNFRKALSLCKADYIAIADQDDIWHHHKISESMRHIGDHLLLYHDSEYIDFADLSLKQSIRSHHRFVAGHCAEKLLYFNCAAGHTFLMKRDLLAITPPFSPSIYYDWWLAYTAACTGKFIYLTDQLVKHRKHQESATRNETTDTQSLRVTHLQLFKNHPLTPTAVAALIEQLMAGYQELQRQNFSMKLFKTLLKYYKSLFFIRKKSAYSLFKLILKECSK